MPDPVHLKPSDIATLDSLITVMGEQAPDTSSMEVLCTPVLTVVAQATLQTLAVLCLSAPGDAQILSQIKDLASQLQSRASHEQLVELRRRAIVAAAQKVSS